MGPVTRTVAFFALLAQLLWPRYYFFQILGTGVSGYTALSVLLLGCALGSFIVRRRLHRNALDGMVRAKLLIGTFVLLWMWRLACDLVVGVPSQAVQTVINFFYVGSWFISSMIIFADARARSALPYFVFAGAFLATAVAIFEVQTQTPIARLLGLSGQSYFMNAFADDLARGGAARVRSVFVHPIVYGQVLAGLAPFALFLFFAGGLRDKLLGLILAACVVTAVAWSNARSPLVVAFAGSACFMAFYLFDLRRRMRLFFAVIGLAAVVGSAPVIMGALEQIQSGRTAEEAVSTTARDIQVSRGLSAVRGSPIMGFGQGSALEYAATRNETKKLLTVDNYFLTVVVETGYGGLAIFVSFLLALGLQGLRAIYSTPWNRERTLNCAALSTCVALTAGLAVISTDDTFSLILQMAGFLVAASAVPAIVRREERVMRARIEATAIPATSP